MPTTVLRYWYIESSLRRYQTSYFTNALNTLTRPETLVIFQEINTLPLLLGIFHPVTDVLPALSSH